MVASFLPGSLYFKFSKSNLSTLTKFDYLVKSGNRLDPIQKSLAVFENKTIKILQQNNQSFNWIEKISMKPLTSFDQTVMCM